tara:strand:+ start:1487 stop:2389 length:903 start_codon:yes stop_codon:yes gene_type:complete
LKVSNNINKNLTLVIMAAGMGSRYGGLKQLDVVGPNGETIIDYSVFDAIKSGFTKIVFIIRKDFKDQFKEKIINKYNNKIKTELVYQDLDDLPGSYKAPSDREKPWGTGQAINAARTRINEPFVVINGDDFYGLESFQVIADYYLNGGLGYAMSAFQLDKTLSDFGAVSRGICEVNQNMLATVIETHDIKKIENGISSDRDISLNGNELVSMNMWGFTPSLFSHLNDMFINFLKVEGQSLKSEFLIPTVVNHLIQSQKEQVAVLSTKAKWFGVTYKDDKPSVMAAINFLINLGQYPKKLF